MTSIMNFIVKMYFQLWISLWLASPSIKEGRVWWTTQWAVFPPTASTASLHYVWMKAHAQAFPTVSWILESVQIRRSFYFVVHYLPQWCQKCIVTWFYLLGQHLGHHSWRFEQLTNYRLFKFDSFLSCQFQEPARRAIIFGGNCREFLRSFTCCRGLDHHRYLKHKFISLLVQFSLKLIQY